MPILGGIGSGVGDQYESKTPKEGAWRRIKVKIDTLVGDRTVGSISLLQPS
ncbi:hypothetical protein QUA44_16850 [Microcoleus sp. N9_A2]|uniref:hypothetical protein n=1 Tax=unclassified Microcoleus TaxID=2642155 RepID=UPI002FD3AE50